MNKQLLLIFKHNCIQFFLQKLWVEHLQAYLVTDTQDYGFSDCRTETPKSLRNKQKSLNVTTNTPIYQLADGKITDTPPSARGILRLGACRIFI